MPNIWCKDTNVTVTGEEFNTRREQRNKAAFAATVVLRCPWDTRAALVEAMIKEDDGLGAAYPGFGSARCASFEIAPFAAQPKLTNNPYESEEIVYKEALITVNYTNLTRSYVETLEPAGESRRLDYKQFSWNETAVGETDYVDKEEAPSTVVRHVTYSVAYKRMKKVPPEFYELVGCVNGHDFNCVTFGAVWGKECMLYIPTTASAASYSPTGESGDINLDFFDYTCKWKVRLNNISWNKFYRMVTAPGDEKEERFAYVPMYKIMSDGTRREYKPFEVDKVGTGGKFPMEILLPPLDQYPPAPPLLKA